MTPRERTPPNRESLAAGVYGTVLVGSVMFVASEDKTLKTAGIIGYMLSTSLVFWLAHGYALLLATPRGQRSVRRVLAAQWPLVTAAFPACIAMAVDEAVAAGSADQAVRLGLIVIIVQLALWGGYIAWRERRPVWIQGATALLNGLFGVFLILLKTLIH